MDTITNNNQATKENDKYNVTFGIKGIDPIPANCAVLLNERKMRIDGKLEPITEFMSISGVKSTKAIDVIKPVLEVLFSIARSKYDYENKYAIIVVEDKDIKTSIKAGSPYTRFLKGNVIYKSNNHGTLNKQLVLNNSLSLTKTALHIKTTDLNLVKEKSHVRRILIFQIAQTIAEQATMLSIPYADGLSAN